MVETRAEGEDVGNPAVRLCEIHHDANACGFNLSKSKWDPYPWVSTVDPTSPAAQAGVLPGDCVLEVNGDDILGLRVSEVAARVRARGDRATLMLWNPGVDPSCTPETLCCGPMPTNLTRLTTCMSNILTALECPICLDTITPPAHQCGNGHLICINCRVRTERCPVCRMRFFRGRSLLADQVFDSLIDAFDLREEAEVERSRLLLLKVYGSKRKEKKTKPEIKFNLLSPTNKFLTRIMGSGKSSSVENLSSPQGENNLKIGDDLGLKAKSLSSNEIFQPESQPVSRTSSILSSRPGSGLLDVEHLTLGPRPASYHGSAGDLQSRLRDDFGIEMGQPSQQTYACPMMPSCCERRSANQLKKHLKFDHEGPVISYSRPHATLSLDWLTKDSVVTVDCHNTTFFVSHAQEHLCVWTLDDHPSKFAIHIESGENRRSCSAAALSQLCFESEDKPSNRIMTEFFKDQTMVLSIENIQ